MQGSSVYITALVGGICSPHDHGIVPTEVYNSRCDPNADAKFCVLSQKAKNSAGPTASFETVCGPLVEEEVLSVRLMVTGGRSSLLGRNLLMSPSSCCKKI